MESVKKAVSRCARKKGTSTWESTLFAEHPQGQGNGSGFPQRVFLFQRETVENPRQTFLALMFAVMSRMTSLISRPSSSAP